MTRTIFASLLALCSVTLVMACGDDGTPTDGGADTAVDTGGGCMGCVDTSGACQAGTTNDACGGGGGACAACDTGSGEACVDSMCAAPPACNNDNCDGCCDGDTCVGGLADGVCGASGFECQDCASTGGTCAMGFCTTACNPETCLTCCDSAGSCVDGASDAQCGRLGEACVTCGGGETCVPSVFDAADRAIGGSCVDSSCTATCAGCCNGSTCETGDEPTACGVTGGLCDVCDAGFTCDPLGTCIPDPTSRWDILVIRGIVPVTDSSGDPWDSFGGLPDPYVEVTVRDPDTMMDTTDVTTTQDNTTTPVWNEAVLTGVAARDILEHFDLTIFDDDIIDSTTIGSCLPLHGGLFTGDPITVDCTIAGDPVSLSFRLRPN